MAEPATGFDRGIDPTAYTPFAGGDRTIGDRGDRLTVTPADHHDSAHSELASLIALGTARLDAGADAEATEFFRRALELGDRTLGADNPDLVLLLNDLTRLYLKQSMYAEAEPLLLRLLDMKRSKGEDHPEVATVLASLAAVRHALGRHESAEQLWRRVLDIRERTLAPNHFAIATALEHLGEACAARGNILEALPAFQRALTIRERTLTAGHPSLRTSRERIADLQLQSAEDPLNPAGDVGTAPAPEKYRLLSGDHLRLTGPAPVARESLAPAVQRELTPPAAMRQTRVVLQVPRDEADLPDVSPARDMVAAATSAVTELPYRDVLESIREEMETPENGAPLRERMNAVVEAITAFLARRQVVAGIIVVVGALLLLAVVKERARADLGPDPIAGASAREIAPPSVPATQANIVSAVRAPVDLNATATTAKPAAAKPRAEERAPARKSEEPAKPETRKLTLPTLSNSVVSHLDSLASKAALAAGRADPLNVVPTTTGLATARPTFDVSDQNNAPTRARLIGELPTPRVPSQVADVEGEVRVRFSVDAEGNPVMSTFAVVSSPNPLLTAAVRKVVPSMRFEPARTGGADARPIADVVETGFRFARQNR